MRLSARTEVKWKRASALPCSAPRAVPSPPSGTLPRRTLTPSRFPSPATGPRPWRSSSIPTTPRTATTSSSASSPLRAATTRIWSASAAATAPCRTLSARMAPSPRKPSPATPALTPTTRPTSCASRRSAPPTPAIAATTARTSPRCSTMPTARSRPTRSSSTPTPA